MSAVHRDRLFVDQSLERRAAHEGDSIDQISIEPLLQITREFEANADRRVIVLPVFVQAINRVAIDLTTGIEEILSVRRRVRFRIHEWSRIEWGLVSFVRLGRGGHDAAGASAGASEVAGFRRVLRRAGGGRRGSAGAAGREVAGVSAGASAGGSEVAGVSAGASAGASEVAGVSAGASAGVSAVAGVSAGASAGDRRRHRGFGGCFSRCVGGHRGFGGCFSRCVGGRRVSAGFSRCVGGRRGFGLGLGPASASSSNISRRLSAAGTV